MDWPKVTVKLDFPLIIDPATGATISEITLSEPDVDKLELIDAIGFDEEAKPKVAQTRELIAILSGVPAEALRKLNIRDFKRVGEAAGPLFLAAAGSPPLPPLPGTGATTATK